MSGNKAMRKIPYLSARGGTDKSQRGYRIKLPVELTDKITPHLQWQNLKPDPLATITLEE